MKSPVIALNGRQLWLRKSSNDGMDFAHYCAHILNRAPADVLREIAEQYENAIHSNLTSAETHTLDIKIEGAT